VAYNNNNDNNNINNNNTAYACLSCQRVILLRFSSKDFDYCSTPINLVYAPNTNPFNIMFSHPTENNILN